MKIGFIGGGNMGRAIAGGIIGAGLCAAQEIIIADVSDMGREAAKRLNVQTTSENRLAAQADVLILSVKPNVIASVIEEIRGTVSADTLIISIAAGRSLAFLEEAFQKPVKLVRVMPNTPALVGEAMSALSMNAEMEKPENGSARLLALDIFNSFGKAEIVSEKLMDVVTAISGSSPAYVFLFIEAMADAAVAQGMPRSQAYTFAAQSVLGSAKMVLETGLHPGQLKDMVCSPGGTTIDAVAALEEKGFRAAVMEAVKVCAEKSRSL